MSKKVAILQSNYIPWKGYFDLINSVDEFILYDEVQYTKNDWRNRNLIKTQNGLQWLTIPVLSKGNFGKSIKEIKIKNIGWTVKHWNAIAINYSKSKYFGEFRGIFEGIYGSMKTDYLSEVNFKFILLIKEILGIKTKISWSDDYKLIGGKTERLVNLCKQTGASEYISGPAAKKYIDEKLFLDADIKLNWMSYEGYSEYEQLFPPFIHSVSIIDLIFNKGKQSKNYMKSF
jgi:hypothetical protein